MVVHDRDVSRFADRSRELWSERTMSDVKYKQNSFLRCCGNCPFASLLAFILTLTGTGICCGCLYYPLRATIEHINNVFEIEYIDHDWIRILRLAVIFVLAIMGGFSMILLIVGSLATGATRHQIYTGFRSRLGGRIATGFFSMIVYGLLLIWLFAMLSLVVPCIGLYILKHRCIEAWAVPTPSDWPNTASPALCLTPGTYGIPVPKQKPDAKVCQQRFNELCTLTEYTPQYLAALIGSFFVVMGLIHFLCCLVANYAHIKDGRKLRDYEEAIREEIEISKLNQG
ncbi:unnamed protein product [Adineta steineri]|uniref:Uncharacterized protein n=1 Tax=Adineta steineri TaxID=433720 RepID=A0A815YXM8_9BILA|nr:unnamed protein product [Adineta steineri]CAF1301639.1 unnamed protein product [Adineta steineri]CAF1311673.1 unnamed protein product [Adineta steineri]CAF1336115.1 unnamed protein product [Adineta steineri]CAF1352822.1 unnamed protein product [Adineta steineri]